MPGPWESRTKYHRVPFAFRRPWRRDRIARRLSRHRGIEEEDQLHKDHIAQNNEDRRHDDAARGGLADALSAAARHETEVAGNDGNEIAEHDGLQRGEDDVRVG